MEVGGAAEERAAPALVVGTRVSERPQGKEKNHKMKRDRDENEKKETERSTMKGAHL